MSFLKSGKVERVSFYGILTGQCLPEQIVSPNKADPLLNETTTNNHIFADKCWPRTGIEPVISD